MCDVYACDRPHTNEYVKKAKKISSKFKVNKYSDSTLEDRHWESSLYIFLSLSFSNIFFIIFYIYFPILLVVKRFVTLKIEIKVIVCGKNVFLFILRVENKIEMHIAQQ